MPSSAESLLAPLAEGEQYLNMHVDAAAALAARVPVAQIQLQAMSMLLDEAQQHGVEVTRGPEIMELHRPEFPGDVAYVRVMAVGRVPR